MWQRLCAGLSPGWKKFRKLHIYSLTTAKGRNWAYFLSAGSGFRDTGRFSNLPYTLGMKLWPKCQKAKVRAAVFKIRGDFEKCHICNWALKLGHWQNSCTCSPVLHQGVEIGFIFALRAAVCYRWTDFQNYHHWWQPKRNQTDSYEESYHGAESDSFTESVRFFGGIRSMIPIQNHDTILFQNHGDSQMKSGKFSPRITFIHIFISDQRSFFWNSFSDRIHIILFTFIPGSARVLISDLFLLWILFWYWQESWMSGVHSNPLKNLIPQTPIFSHTRYVMWQPICLHSLPLGVQVYVYRVLEKNPK